MALLEVKNLKTYFFTKEGIVKAVDGNSFSLEKGEILGIVGYVQCSCWFIRNQEFRII